MSSKESTAGVPMREAFEKADADRSLFCAACRKEIVRLALRDEQFVVASPIRRLRLSEADLGVHPGLLLTADPMLLHEYMKEAHQDGLDFYCPECDAMLCEDHYHCIPQWDEGFYDYTLGVCFVGHERVMDD